MPWPLWPNAFCRCRDDTAQVEIAHAVEQRQLLLDAEVMRVDPGIGKGSDNVALPADRLRLGRVVGDQHRGLGKTSVRIQPIGIASAQRQQAVEAVVQVPWAVGDGYYDHEVVAPVITVFRDQRLQFAECRLV